MILQDTLEIRLAGLSELVVNEPFTHEILGRDVAERAMLKKALTITARESVISNAETPLVFDVLFEPLRVFQTKVDFVINKSSGGRWRFELQLSAEEGDIDGVIKMEALVHSTASRKVAIPNPHPSRGRIPFEAFMSLCTGPEFTVRPSRGIIEGEETVVQVVYAPTDYGNLKSVGKLMVQSDDMEWAFDLQGKVPKYVPPAGTAKVTPDTELRADTTRKWAEEKARVRPNFVRGNLNTKHAKDSSPTRR